MKSVHYFRHNFYIAAQILTRDEASQDCQVFACFLFAFSISLFGNKKFFGVEFSKHLSKSSNSAIVGQVVFMYTGLVLFHCTSHPTVDTGS